MPVHNTLKDINKNSGSFEDENIISTIRRPKVSLGSASNDGYSGESDDQMDIIIAEELIWCTHNKIYEKATNKINHIDTEAGPLDNEKEDDDSDIVCLGISSGAQLQGNGALHSEVEQHGIDESSSGSNDCGIINLDEEKQQKR